MAVKETPTPDLTRTEGDSLCKFLAERYPEQLAEWLFGVSGVKVTPVKTELSRAPVRADSAIVLDSIDDLLHVELQTTARSHAPLDWRMADYYVGFWRLFPKRRIRQVLVVLHDNGQKVPSGYQSETFSFRYQVIKLWEQDPARLLRYDGLASLAVLCQAERGGERLLEAVAERLRELPESERREQFNLARALAGLRFRAEDIYRILQGGNMLEESVIYQDIVRQGLLQGLHRERELVLRMLARRCGPISARRRKELDALPIEQVEALGEALLDFKDPKDLSKWLKQQQIESEPEQ